MVNLRKVWWRIRRRIQRFYSDPEKQVMPVDTPNTPREQNFHTKIATILKKCENAPLARSNDERCRRCSVNRCTVFTGPCNHCVVCRKCAAIALWEAKRTATKAQCMECHVRISSIRHVDFDRPSRRYLDSESESEPERQQTTR